MGIRAVFAPIFGAGKVNSSFRAAELKRLLGMVLPTNGWPLVGSTMILLARFGAEKSPLICAGLGTVSNFGLGLPRPSVDWNETKRKVRLRIKGPPSEPPV